MPVLSRINIYPIKSLDGVAVSEARLMPTGPLDLDRRWAITQWDGSFVNAKRHSAIHLLATEFDLHKRTVTLGVRGQPQSATVPAPATFSLEDAAAMGAWFAKFFGLPVHVVEDAVRHMPDDPDAPGPTIVSTATLREVATWFGMDLDGVRRRFRANLEIDGVPAFWEDGLYGPVPGDGVRLRIGEVELIGSNPCQRCPVPSRHPDTGVEDRTFARKFCELREQTLPAWAPRGRFNHFYRLAVNTLRAENSPGKKLCVGDEVTV